MGAALKVKNEFDAAFSQMLIAFSDSAKMTLSQMCELEAKVVSEKVQSPLVINSVVSGLVGLTFGDHRGLFTISFEKDTVLYIHNTLLDEKETEISESVVDLVGELSNMIYGVAKSKLNDNGYQLTMAIPSVSQGNFIFTSKTNSLTTVLEFKIEDKYTFKMSLAVE